MGIKRVLFSWLISFILWVFAAILLILIDGNGTPPYWYQLWALIEIILALSITIYIGYKILWKNESP